MSGWCLGRPDGVCGCLDGVCGCLNDVCVVSEGVWGGININSRKYKAMILRYCLFFQCPILQKKCLCLGMSELYLGVSAWGLRVSGDELMQNILAQIYVGHVSLDIAFYSSAR